MKDFGIDARRLEQWARAQPEVRELYSANKDEWVNSAVEIIGQHQGGAGDTTGLTHLDTVMRFRPAETTLWIGANGHGKTQALGQFTARWALQGKHCVVLSLEMHPARQVARLARLMTGLAHPSEKQIRDAMARLESTYTIANMTGRIAPELALAVLLFSAKELGAQHVVIDNLTMLLSVDNDSGSSVQDFVGHAVRLTSQFRCHTHLVAHVRKPEDKRQVPDRYSCRGTGAAPDQVDNVIAVWRNEVKEDKRNEGDIGGREEPDAVFHVDKQRETGDRGMCSAGFYPPCGQFTDHKGAPTPMV